MALEEKGVAGKVFLSLFLLLISVAGGYLIYLRKEQIFPKVMTAYASLNVPEATSSSLVVKISFIVIFASVLALIILLVVRRGQTFSGKIIEHSLKDNQTDLDVLYSTLKDKKNMKIIDISKKFEVTEEIAMGWGKILESSNLATIEYPSFGKPFIKIGNDNEEKK